MKSKIFMGCMMAAALLTASCNDFLEEDPKGLLTPGNYLDSQAALEGSVTALYEKVNLTQGWTNMMYPQWQGDDITANPGSNKQACAELDAFSASDNNKGVTAAWKNHYAVVKAANLIIETAGNAPVSDTEKNIAIGNAKYWRAYAYYYLVRIFGPLPLITSSAITAPDQKPDKVEDVYKLIVEDLKDAEAKLPTGYDKAPRHHDGVDAWITKQAAQATLAAVYMSMAGYPLNLGPEYYKLAAEKAKEVIDKAGEYGFYLEDEWNQVYSMGHNYNKATLVGIDNSPINGSWDHDSQLTSCCRFEGLGDGGWGDAWGEIKFWKNYPEGPRKDAVYAPKVTFEDGNGNITKVVDWWAKDDQGEPVVAANHPMFCVFTTNADADGKELAQPYNYLERNYRGMTNGHRHRVIRYSEVLLWYAESAARGGVADLSLAKRCLKLVHGRACNDADQITIPDMGTYAIDNLSADQLAEAAYWEHGWEVAGYWVAMVTRRSDEFRMNRLKENFDYRVANVPIEVAPDVKVKESVSVTKTTWAGDESIYIPYPNTEKEKNPNLKR
ncbi:RagB/SusD family nutrient uptake outer membrane protein [bacterium]|nr:RagB/SusD family nutrient uptake outer membrane protein [bacterium]